MKKEKLNLDMRTTKIISKEENAPLTFYGDKINNTELPFSRTTR